MSNIIYGVVLQFSHKRNNRPITTKCSCHANMIPSAFVHLDTFPLGPSNKVDRGALPDPLTHGLGPAGAAARARDNIETELLQLWRQVLKLNDIGINDAVAAGPAYATQYAWFESWNIARDDLS